MDLAYLGFFKELQNSLFLNLSKKYLENKYASKLSVFF